MNEKISVKPDTIYLEDLLKDIEGGEYKVPKFQREFVWSTSQMLMLFDSISKGYPIGSLLFWKTQGYRTKDEIGPFIVTASGISYSYILDGYQRISTLFGVLINPKHYSSDNINNEISKDFLIHFDIKENTFSYIRSIKSKNVFLIPLFEIYDNKELFSLLRELDKEDISESERNLYIENARNLHDILHKYKLPFVEIKGGDLQSAVDIFSRINSTGVEISTDFMISALSYNDKSGFTFSDSITDFIDSLQKYNFEDLKRDTVLNCIASTQGSIYFDMKLEDLAKLDLETLTKTSFIHIEKAIKYLYEKINVIDLRLLPYPTQLIFISEYFRINPEPSEQDLNRLENWFWITSYSNYFTNYSLAQQRIAFAIFKEFAKGSNSDGIYRVNDTENFVTAKYPEKINFTSVRTKALQLFMLRQIESAPYGDKVSIIEQSVFKIHQKSRMPANMILRISVEFENNSNQKEISRFIQEMRPEELKKYFFNEEIRQYFLDSSIEKFINSRERYIRESEKQFVENFGIKYI